MTNSWSPNPETTDVSQTSVKELIGNITTDMSTLLRQEIELAKAELRQEAAKTGKAAGMFGGAGLAGWMVAFFLSCALWWGLSNVMDQGWAALIVAVVWAVIGGVLYSTARKKMREVQGLRQTAETVREVPPALKGEARTAETNGRRRA